MKVVLDTNALLVSIPRKSFYRPIFDSLLKNKFDLLVSNEILYEYEEIISNKANQVVSSNIIELLLSLKNVKRSEIFFRRNLIARMLMTINMLIVQLPEMQMSLLQMINTLMY